MQLEAVGARPRIASNWCGSADANCPEKPTTITQTAKAPTNPRTTVSLFIGDIHDERHSRVNGEAGAHSRSASEFWGWVMVLGAVRRNRRSTRLHFTGADDVTYVTGY